MHFTIMLPVACVDGTTMGILDWESPFIPTPGMALTGLEQVNDEDGNTYYIDSVEIDIKTGQVAIILEIEDCREPDGHEPLKRLDVKDNFGKKWTWDDEYPIEILEYSDEQDFY